MKTSPSPTVVAWINDHDPAQLYLTSISIAEICYGIRVLPDGRRRRNLEDTFEQFVGKAFESRVLGFDEAAARVYGDVMGHNKSIGRIMSVADGQIAAIARANGCGAATRNIRNFEDCGIPLIDPFE